MLPKPDVPEVLLKPDVPEVLLKPDELPRPEDPVLKPWASVLAKLEDARLGLKPLLAESAPMLEDPRPLWSPVEEESERPLPIAPLKLLPVVGAVTEPWLELRKGLLLCGAGKPELPDW